MSVIAQEGPAPSPLENLQRLLREKTRFESQDIETAEHDIAQDFEVRSTHRLFSHLVDHAISGRFTRRATDREARHPGIAARADAGARVEAAVSRLERQLGEPATAHDTVSAGVYLPAAVRHWNLESCSRCAGRGKNSCRTCHGQRQEICPTCSGGLSVQCDAYSCCGTGTTNCHACHGSGTVYGLVPYQVTETVYVGGQSQTSFRTEYRHEASTCTAMGCSRGQVFCYRCSGTGRIQCPVCHATGRITCRDCGGVGHHVCTPCEGSGQSGSAAWIEVHVEPVHELIWPAAADPVAFEIGKAIGLSKVVTEAGGLVFGDFAHTRAGDDPCIVARYRGRLAILRIDAQCGGRSFRLVGFGHSRTWHTLDGIVESLLQRDLDVLGAALVRANDEEFWSPRLGTLLPALRHVTSSELNAELVEAALGDGPRQEHAIVVSPGYAQALQSSLLGSLRLIYTRSALQQWWRGALLSGGLMLGVWALSHVLVGVLAGLLMAPAALWLLRRRIRTTLVDALGDAGKADRAMAMAVKARRQHVATAITVVPIAVVALVLASVLPPQAPWKRAVGSSPTDSSSAANRQAVDAAPPSVTAAALALRAAGRLPEARASLRAAVESNDAAALGPYAWMLVHNEGGAAGTAQTNDAEALALVRRALAANPADAWALATEGMMLAEGWGLPRNLDAGMQRLARAAEAGLGPAMHALGMYHLNLKKRPEQARTWFARAAALGQAADLYNLGLMDWRGEGIPKPDRAKAMKLWEQAAAKGEPRAVQAVQLGRPPDGSRVP